MSYSITALGIFWLVLAAYFVATTGPDSTVVLISMNGMFQFACGMSCLRMTSR